MEDVQIGADVVSEIVKKHGLRTSHSKEYRRLEQEGYLVYRQMPQKLVNALYRNRRFKGRVSVIKARDEYREGSFLYIIYLRPGLGDLNQMMN